MSNKSGMDITVFIPTYNAEPYLEEVLTAIYAQKIDKAYEVLIIDSGSTDKTLETIKKFPKVRVHEIPNEEFGHGKTRQLAAEMANGEIIVYLSHDATPSHNRWLYEITKPFGLNPDIAGVMGKQIPRLHCFPMMKYEINSVFRKFGPDFGTTLFYKDDFIENQSVYDMVRFYSDVNSAARRSVLLGKVPYKDVPYAEDQVFGEDILEAGLLKAYVPRGSVLHSNDVELRHYNKRIFDETFGLRKSGANIAMPSKANLVVGLPTHVARDSVRILLDPQYSIWRKAYWIFLNPLFHIQKWRGFRTAVKTELDDTSLKNKSLEHDNRHSG